jgi:hypothetical protein
MANSNNVVSIGRGAAKLRRLFWSFSDPHQIVSDPNMGLDEKRAILAAWASDVHAIESLPTLRHLPGTPFPVAFSAIMDARARLDKVANAHDDEPPPPSPGAIQRPRERQLFREAA